MRQHTAAPAPVTVTHGALTIVITRPVDGGFAINTFTGTTREANLCLTTPDRPTAELAFRVIRDGGDQGVHPDGIHAALQARLRREFTRALDTGRRAYADAIEALLDALDTPAQRQADKVALDELAETLRRQDVERTGQPTTRDGRPLSGWGQLKADFATTHQGA